MSPQDYVRLGIGILVTIFAFYVTIRLFSSLKQNFSKKIKGSRTLVRVWWPILSPPQAVYLGNSDIEVIYKNISTIIDFKSIKSIAVQALIVPPWINVLLWVKRNDIIFSLIDGSSVVAYNMTEKQTNNILELVNNVQPNIYIENHEKIAVLLIGGLRFVDDVMLPKTTSNIFMVGILILLSLVAVIVYFAYYR